MVDKATAGKQPLAGGKPSLLGRISGALGERVDRFALFRMTRELRGIREALEILADQQLRAAGQRPKFSPQSAVGAPEDVDDQPSPAEGGFIGQGDYLTVYMIEELAREANIRLTGMEDLETLALERGWVDAEGKFLMLPISAGGEGPYAQPAAAQPHQP